MPFWENLQTHWKNMPEAQRTQLMMAGGLGLASLMGMTSRNSTLRALSTMGLLGSLGWGGYQGLQSMMGTGNPTVRQMLADLHIPSSLESSARGLIYSVLSPDQIAAVQARSSQTGENPLLAAIKLRFLPEWLVGAAPAPGAPAAPAPAAPAAPAPAAPAAPVPETQAAPPPEAPAVPPVAT
jgi:hypothetical protein